MHAVKDVFCQKEPWTQILLPTIMHFFVSFKLEVFKIVFNSGFSVVTEVSERGMTAKKKKLKMCKSCTEFQNLGVSLKFIWSKTVMLD